MSYRSIELVKNLLSGSSWTHDKTWKTSRRMGNRLIERLVHVSPTRWPTTALIGPNAPRSSRRRRCPGPSPATRTSATILAQNWNKSIELQSTLLFFVVFVFFFLQIDAYIDGCGRGARGQRKTTTHETNKLYYLINEEWVGGEVMYVHVCMCMWGWVNQ